MLSYIVKNDFKLTKFRFKLNKREDDVVESGALAAGHQTLYDAKTLRV